MESELADLVCCDGRGRLSSKEDGGSSEAHSALPGDLEEENEPEDLQPMPAPIKELVDASLSEYLKIKFQAPWTLCTERPDYKIWNAPSPHKKDILYWKIEMTPVYGTREGITAEMFDYSTRCSWDKASVWKGSVLRRFKDNYMVVQWFTYPQGGGIITPREFLEARLVRRDPDGHLYLTSPSIDDATVKGLGIKFTPGEGSTRAKTFPGNGFSLEPLEALKPGDDPDGFMNFKMTLISCIELGGWLAPGLVNLFTTQSLVDSSDRECARFKIAFPPPKHSG